MAKSLAERIEEFGAKCAHVGFVDDGDLRAILASVRELERNDARYRFLREHHDKQIIGWHVRIDAWSIVPIGQLDQAIDAAISKTKGST